MCIPSEKTTSDAQKQRSNSKPKQEEQTSVKKVKKKDPIKFDLLQAIQVTFVERIEHCRVKVFWREGSIIVL